jgi:cytochrome c oxidase subunit 2
MQARQALWWALIIPLLVASAVGLVLGCIELVKAVPEGVSTFSDDIDFLYKVIMGVTGVALFATETLLVLFLIKYRRREGAKPYYVHGNHRLELVWTIIPGALLFFLAFYQQGTWSRAKKQFPKEAQAVNIQVLAQQFSWNIRYPGLDGRFGTDDDFATTAELRIPKGKPVIIQLQSKDVIHSFKLPHFRVMQDTVPGTMIRTWFEATKIGSYELACAELCGLGHTTMRGEVTVLTQEDYDAWVREQSKSNSLNKAAEATQVLWREFWNWKLVPEIPIE